MGANRADVGLFGRCLYHSIFVILLIITVFIDALLMCAAWDLRANHPDHDSQFDKRHMTLFYIGVGVQIWILIDIAILDFYNWGSRKLFLCLFQWFAKEGLKVSRAKTLLVLSLLLPANILFLYPDLGEPVYDQNRIIQGPGYDIPALMTTWPEGGGIRVDTSTWHVYDARNQSDLGEIYSHHCYQPGSFEFVALMELRSAAANETHRPKQGYCVSALGHALQSVFGYDSDMWEEFFKNSVLSYAALTGFVARKSMEGESGGFLEDIFDVFEMYMFTFVDTQQMIEGRQTLREGRDNFGWFIYTALWMGYLTIILRAFLLMGWNASQYKSDPIYKLKKLVGRVAKQDEIDETIFAKKVSCLMSLIFIELPFLSVRLGLFFSAAYRIPLSELAIKNTFCILWDVYVIMYGERTYYELISPDSTSEQRSGANTWKPSRMLRTPCRYGAECYKLKDPAHSKYFFHPLADEDTPGYTDELDALAGNVEVSDHDDAKPEAPSWFWSRPGSCTACAGRDKPGRDISKF